jgi:hypothetical protein
MYISHAHIVQGWARGREGTARYIDGFLAGRHPTTGLHACRVGIHSPSTSIPSTCRRRSAGVPANPVSSRREGRGSTRFIFAAAALRLPPQSSPARLVPHSRGPALPPSTHCPPVLANRYRQIRLRHDPLRLDSFTCGPPRPAAGSTRPEQDRWESTHSQRWTELGVATWVSPATGDEDGISPRGLF